MYGTAESMNVSIPSDSSDVSSPACDLAVMDWRPICNSRWTSGAKVKVTLWETNFDWSYPPRIRFASTRFDPAHVRMAKLQTTYCIGHPQCTPRTDLEFVFGS